MHIGIFHQKSKYRDFFQMCDSNVSFFKVVLLNQHINFQVEFPFLLLQKWWEGFWCGNSFSSLFELQYNDKKVFIFHFLKILYFVCKRQLGTSPSSWCLSLIEKKWYSCNLICYLILSHDLQDIFFLFWITHPAT